MKQVGLPLLLAALCAARMAGAAEEPDRSEPATTNVRGAAYPRVDGASRVELRVKAPDATKVRVNFWSGPKVDMVKQSDGFWTFTTPPMAPGLHYYVFVIDGADVADPGEPRVLRREPLGERGGGSGSGRDLLLGPGRAPRPGPRGLVPLQGDGELAPRPRLHAAAVRHAGEGSAIPSSTCSTEAARTRRGGPGRAARTSSSTT